LGKGRAKTHFLEKSVAKNTLEKTTFLCEVIEGSTKTHFLEKSVAKNTF